MSIDDQLKKLNLKKGEGILLDPDPMSSRVNIAEFNVAISRHVDGTFIVFLDLAGINRALLPATPINITGSGPTAAAALSHAAAQLTPYGGAACAFGVASATDPKPVPHAMVPEPLLAPVAETEEAGYVDVPSVEPEADDEVEVGDVSVSEALSRIDLSIDEMEKNQQ